MCDEYGVVVSRERDPSSFYECQITDPTSLENWVHSELARDSNNPEALWCAMCCARMVAKANGFPTPSISRLFERAKLAGVYKEGLESRGAHHKELAEFIRGEIRLPAYAEQGLTANDVLGWLDSRYFVIASVHPSIRDESAPIPERRSGHFVFVYGYNFTNDGAVFLINNSTGFRSNKSQVGARVSYERFGKFFSGNAIVVKCVL